MLLINYAGYEQGIIMQGKSFNNYRPELYRLPLMNTSRKCNQQIQTEATLFIHCLYYRRQQHSYKGKALLINNYRPCGGRPNTEAFPESAVKNK